MNKKSIKNSVLIICCMCICCIFLSSCFSVPGEKELEERNLAADYYELALKYSDTKQYEKALTCFQKARERAGSDDYVKIDYQIARTYALSNKWDKAYEMYVSLLELDAENTNLQEALAYITYKKGEKEKALQMFAELSEKNTSNERIQKNYSEIFNELNPPEQPEPDSSQDQDTNQDQEAIGS